MAKRRTSLRESIRTGGHDYSLLAVAAMILVFGYALSQHVIPNYHELQSIERRHKETRGKVSDQKAENAKLEDQTQALDDPYYLAQIMVERYKWRYAPLQVENPPAVK
ncbi:MAG: hypothetical protein IT464_15255 [Planctomycetes bacterium]|nr:hypothetical protein [Planctomycetota bacterium]